MDNRAKHKNLLFDSLPPKIYFDTNFVVHCLIKQDKHYYNNLTCRYFIDRLVESKTEVYFSIIIFPEFWHSVLKIAVAKNKGYRTEAEVYAYLKKNKAGALREHIDFIKKKQEDFDRLMSILNEKEPRVYIIETCRLLSDEALRFMGDYQLLSYDAIHFASATIDIPATDDKDTAKPSIFDIATMDSDLEGVKCEYLKIWNRGCNEKDILRYERTLPKDKLQPDGLLIKEKAKQNTLQETLSK